MSEVTGRTPPSRRERSGIWLPGCLALVSWLLLVTTALYAQTAPDMEPEAFEQALQRAEQLNVTEPWQESQEVLDRLRPHLGTATSDQYARFILLEVRNLGLAGRLDESLARVDALLERDMSQRYRLHALTRGANVALIGRRLTTAFDYLNRALELLEDPDLRRFADDVYVMAANMYSLVEEHELAERYGRLAVDVAQDRGPRDRCFAYIQLGLALLRSGDFDEARSVHVRAVEPCRQSGDELLSAIIQYRLADLVRRTDRYEAAERLITEAIERLDRAGYAFGLAEARLFHARLARDMGRPDRVETLLAQAMEQLREDDNWQKYAEGHRMLAEVARGRGNLEEAMAHYDRYVAARDRYMQLLRDRQTAFLEVQFEANHTEQQLRLLRERERVRELETATRIQQQRLRFGFFVLVAVLFGVLLVLLARATRDRRRFQSLSERDALTALSNHTRFFELADKTMQLSHQKQIPYTLVLADIDHFKRVNDRHGHQAGDVVLRRVAARLREHFSKKGIIGRIGGEEFGIALPGIAPEHAQAMIESFRRSLSALRYDDDAVAVTLSFGVAAPRDDESVTSVRERADQALYEAKRAGRDRVVRADEGED
ncbi:MAG: diguanylate cyclase domain-containing protein [Candidatus Wenzhouxiangella sp. M2_3B_020]